MRSFYFAPLVLSSDNDDDNKDGGDESDNDNNDNLWFSPATTLRQGVSMPTRGCPYNNSERNKS